MSTPSIPRPAGLYVHISITSLVHNIRLLRGLCPQAKLLAVIKANAYGHGLERIAITVAPWVDGLGVARIEEAIRVRKAGVNKTPVLVMSPIKSPDLFRQCTAHAFDVVLQDEREIDMLASLDAKATLRVWLKINCGLHRLGFAPEDYPSALQRILKLPQVRSVVAMTHFSSSSDADLDITRAQLDIFHNAFQDGVESTSTANSGAICLFPEARSGWVRPGLLLYGVHPAPDLVPDLPLRPVMRFYAPIIALREVAKGERVGYGGWWRAPRTTRIAIVGAGYADGYPCFDSDSSIDAYLDGERVPLVGQVSMDMLAVDVSACTQPQVGDHVELWGEHISVHEVAQRSKRRLYTLLTGIGERVPRIYS